MASPLHATVKLGGLKMRDEFTMPVRRVIAGRAGWRCSNPRCRALTEGPKEDPTKSASVGIAAHITAASPGGPRYDPRLTTEQRGSAENGIWLCDTCARRIDGDENHYLTGVLRFWKLDSEEIVERELGRPAESPADLQPLRYSTIGICNQCLWWRAHRLHKVLLKDGLHADFGFHEIPPNAWQSAGKSPENNPVEPVLDVTLINDGSRVGTATAIGLELVDTWTVMKGLSVAQKVPVHDVYILPLTKLVPGEPQVVRLEDPIAIPPLGGFFRFQLWLENFAAAVANESLVRIVTEFEGGLHRSGIVYLGRY
jgi:hypothetical protein